MGTGKYALPFGDGRTEQHIGITDERRQAIGVIHVENWAFKEDFEQFTETLRQQDEAKRKEELQRLQTRALEIQAE